MSHRVRGSPSPNPNEPSGVEKEEENSFLRETPGLGSSSCSLFPQLSSSSCSSSSQLPSAEDGGDEKGVEDENEDEYENDEDEELDPRDPFRAFSRKDK